MLNSWSVLFYYINIILISFLFSQDVPELFEHNQSTLQSFYFFNNVLIDGNPIESDDWVGAFNGNVCVGARKWDTSLCGGGLCDLPVMGNDGAIYTTGYMQSGDVPTFKIYDASEDIYYTANISSDYSGCNDTINCSWANFAFNSLEELSAISEENNIPDLFEFNISTLSAYYFFYDAYDLNGQNLEPNDWVGAFNGDVCVGAKKWDTSLCAGGVCDVPVMGDDGSDYSTGYMHPGEIPVFKIYDASEGIYYDAIVSEAFPWTNFDLNMINYIQAVDYVELSIPLHYQNNLISFYTLPDNNSLSNVVIDIQDNLIGVITTDLDGSFSAQNNNGQWIGSLTELDTYNGYWFRMSSESDILTVQGPPPDPEKIYELSPGLNLISFPTSGFVSIPDGIDDSIEDQIISVIGESRATARLNGQWVGSLTAFEGGRGYWIDSNTDLDFQYNLENLGLSKYNKDMNFKLFPFNQSRHQSFYFMNISDLENVEKGDWIVAFNNNVIVGARQWNGGVVDVPVMGFDNDDATIGYCNLNEIPTFKVYSNYNHQFAEIQSNQITQFIPNSIVYVQNLGFGSMENLILDDFNISSVYPNPFNPETTINFSIPYESDISIAIYNIKGEMITSLLNDNFEAGHHSIRWDASIYPSGIYFVKMLSSSNSEIVHKLMLVK